MQSVRPLYREPPRAVSIKECLRTEASPKRKKAKRTERSGGSPESIERAAFVAGAECAEARWQEKTRWIPIAEGLPQERQAVVVKTDMYPAPAYSLMAGFAF